MAFLPNEPQSFAIAGYNWVCTQPERDYLSIHKIRIDGATIRVYCLAIGVLKVRPVRLHKTLHQHIYNRGIPFLRFTSEQNTGRCIAIFSFLGFWKSGHDPGMKMIGISE